MENFQIFDQNHGLTPFRKIAIFDFLNFLFFYSLKRLFSFLEYRQTILLADFDYNKKMEKFQIFDQKPWTNPFGKNPIFDYFNFLFFYSLKRLFSFLEYRQTILLADFDYNKKMEKFQIFDQKPWTNPFGKNPIFDYFNFLFFYSLKRLFSFLEYRQTILLADFDYNKKMEKFQIFDQKPWTNPFGKNPIFDFFNFLFFIVLKSFFPV